MHPPTISERDRHALPPSITAKNAVAQDSSRFGDQEAVRACLMVLPRVGVDAHYFGPAAEGRTHDARASVSTCSTVDIDIGEEVSLYESSPLLRCFGRATVENLPQAIAVDTCETAQTEQWLRDVAKMERVESGGKRKRSSKLSIVAFGRKIGRKLSKAWRKDSGYESSGPAVEHESLLEGNSECWSPITTVTTAEDVRSEHLALRRQPNHSKPIEDSDQPATPSTSSAQSDVASLTAELRFSLEKKLLSGNFDEVALELKFDKCNGNRTTESDQNRASIAHRLELEVERDEFDREYRRLQESEMQQSAPIRGRTMLRRGRKKVQQPPEGIEEERMSGHVPANTAVGSVGSSSDVSSWPSIL